MRHGRWIAWGFVLSALLRAGHPGYPDREADLDVLPGFRTPPPGYGEVPFYWWLGDPLTKERLEWQLDQLKGKSIASLQINYAHSDKGGRMWGLTYESEPRLFSEEWWKLFGWFLKEAGRRGMSVSLSDYTLGWPGQGWYFDEILKESPEASGAALAHVSRDCTGGVECLWDLPAPPLSVMAYGRNGAARDLRPNVTGSRLRWTPPEGAWRVIAVYSEQKPGSLDPMNRNSGRQTVAKFFQRFEDRHPHEGGRGLNFFFSDELGFGVRGWLWNTRFAEEFRKRKGYDVIPWLPALFTDVGPTTPKVRLDYSDVMVSLEEESYFRPLYEWHASRGMIYGCDHGGRGRDVTEFGDYFRTQRWMVAPGCDQPRLGSDVVKNKVASSIAHLYQRPRTWLEGFYGSGWGTSSADVVDATWRNFAMGHNLLTLHGLYYSTHGGWWEWAPPCNHFRMPYWAHMGEFLRASERLSYLLSQGVHRADVAIVYPVAPVEAGMGGKESVDAAFALGTHLYGRGIDFDFIDFESLARAQAGAGRLNVAGESYRVLVLPAMRAVRHSTIETALEFHRGGGMVILLGALPEASDRVGSGDPELIAAVHELSGRRARTPEEVEAMVNGAFPRDFTCSAPNPYVLHRRIGPRDVYMVYGVPNDTECSFRASGKVELWDPWTGMVRALPVVSQSAESTRLRMPLSKTEAQLIIFSPGKAEISTNRVVASRRIPIEGDWELELVPSLDNRWGDYRLPAANIRIGPEARRFRYVDAACAGARPQDPALDDSKWTQVTCSYGPRFWKLGSVSADADTRTLEARLASTRRPDRTLWQPVEFSWRWGVEGDPGHQGYHGLKAEMPDDLVALGVPRLKSTEIIYEAELAGSQYYLWTSVVAPHPMKAHIVAGGVEPAMVWINGAALPPGAATADLRAGGSPVLLRYDKPGRVHFVFEDPSSPREWKQTAPLAGKWFNRPGVLPFDTRPDEARPAGWYRFTSPPGLKAMTIVARGTARVWTNGVPAALQEGMPRPDGAREYRAVIGRPVSGPVKVAILIEQERGSYGGASLPEPVTLECGPGRLPPGDWARIDGLSSYSGGAWFRKDVPLSAEEARGPVALDLGGVVATAEVRVNGRQAGIRVAPPWTVDVTGLVHSGVNRIEVLVYNTLANHYQTIPTRYRGSPASGLLGPVSFEVGGVKSGL